MIIYQCSYYLLLLLLLLLFMNKDKYIKRVQRKNSTHLNLLGKKPRKKSRDRNDSIPITKKAAQ